MPPPSIAHTPTLMAWLDAGAGHHAEYGNGLSNHLPMAALALHRLGAPPARLQAWAEAYAAQLEPAPPAQAWPAFRRAARSAATSQPAARVWHNR